MSGLNILYDSFNILLVATGELILLVLREADPESFNGVLKSSVHVSFLVQGHICITQLVFD